jgi:BspA type Leucine rich repeat region (6 copies)/SAM domain (Sterile alpha motif)
MERQQQTPAHRNDKQRRRTQQEAMTDKIQSILEAEGLSALLGKFNEQGVTDSILSDLTDSDLKELGVEKLGERKRLLAAFGKSEASVSEKLECAEGQQTFARQEDFTYEAANGQITITGFRGKGHAVIPERFDDLPLPVCTIARTAFERNGMLTSISIPDSVTCIEKYSFSRCSSLATVIIGNGVTKIENATFAGCPSLVNAQIGSGVKIVEGLAFSGCEKLHNIIVDAGNAAYVSIDGVLFDKAAVTIALCPPGKQGSYKIPDGVAFIGQQSFSGCTHLTHVAIPDSVKGIGNSAFSRCSGLSSITIGRGVTSIGEWAFSQCMQLKDVVIPETVITIGESAFFGCTELTSISIPDAVKSIGHSAFYGCTKLIFVHLGNGLERIDGGVFGGCASLATLNLPDNVICVAISAFDDCTSLANVSIPNAADIISGTCELVPSGFRPQFEKRGCSATGPKVANTTRPSKKSVFGRLFGT